MNFPALVLHQWCISPYCVKVQKVLDFKQLPYCVEDYGGIRALKVRSLAPSGKLPVLDYGTQRIEDSSAIVRLLDERHPAPPLFPPSVDRHLVHMLEDWADESLYWYELWLRLDDPLALERAAAAACVGRPAYERVLFKLGLSRQRSKLAAQGIGRYPRETVLSNLRGHFAAIEGRLRVHGWLAGDAPSLADIAVAAQLDEVVRTSSLVDELRALPALWAWLERCDFPRAAAG
jgi:glutathione S-transferase